MTEPLTEAEIADLPSTATYPAIVQVRTSELDRYIATIRSLQAKKKRLRAENERLRAENERLRAAPNETA